MSCDWRPLAVCDERTDALRADVDRLTAAQEKSDAKRESDLEKIYKKLDEFGNRLPTWVFAMAAVGSLIIGILATKVVGH